MTTDWVLRGNVRLTVEHFDDGWGWHAWECLTEGGWQALRPPAPQNARRRFMAQHEAEAFLLLLSVFIADIGPESSRRLGSGRVASRSLSGVSARGAPR